MGWVKKHPLLWTLLSFVVVSLPQWATSVWSIFSGEPIALAIRRVLNTTLPELSPYWITVPTGLLMFGFLVYQRVHSSGRLGASPRPAGEPAVRALELKPYDPLVEEYPLSSGHQPLSLIRCVGEDAKYKPGEVQSLHSLLANGRVKSGRWQHLGPATVQWFRAAACNTGSTRLEHVVVKVERLVPSVPGFHSLPLHLTHDNPPDGGSYQEDFALEVGETRPVDVIAHPRFGPTSEVQHIVKGIGRAIPFGEYEVRLVAHARDVPAVRMQFLIASDGDGRLTCKVVR